MAWRRLGGIAPSRDGSKAPSDMADAKTKLPASCSEAPGVCGKDGARPAIARCRSKDPCRIQAPATGFQQDDFLGNPLRLHTASFLLRQLVLRKLRSQRGRGGALSAVWSGGADRWKIPSRYAARSARAASAIGPAEFRAAIRGSVRIAKSLSFSKRDDRSQRPARDSRCQTVAPGTSRCG